MLAVVPGDGWGRSKDHLREVQMRTNRREQIIRRMCRLLYERSLHWCSNMGGYPAEIRIVDGLLVLAECNGGMDLSVYRLEDVIDWYCEAKQYRQDHESAYDEDAMADWDEALSETEPAEWFGTIEAKIR